MIHIWNLQKTIMKNINSSASRLTRMHGRSQQFCTACIQFSILMVDTYTQKITYKTTISGQHTHKLAKHILGAIAFAGPVQPRLAASNNEHWPDSMAMTLTPRRMRVAHSSAETGTILHTKIFSVCLHHLFRPDIFHKYFNAAKIRSTKTLLPKLYLLDKFHICCNLHLSKCFLRCPNECGLEKVKMDEFSQKNVSPNQMIYRNRSVKSD